MENNICQSCGMPLGDENFYGTNKDSKKIKKYCIYCFKEGEFTFEGSYEEFVEKQVEIAKDKFNISEKEAQNLANKILPNLKRWKNNN